MYVKKKDFCGVIMPSECTKILEFHQYQTFEKIPAIIIHQNLESLIKRTDGFTNNPEKPSITKIGEDIPCGYSMSTKWTFEDIGNKRGVYRGEDCMKTFCKSLTECAIIITNFKNKKIKPLISK